MKTLDQPGGNWSSYFWPWTIDLSIVQEIQSWMKAKSQVPISTPPNHTCDRCGCVHGLGECTVEGELAQAMDELNYVRGRNNHYEQFFNNNNFHQG